MRQQYLQHIPGCSSLLVFFAGWGAEPCMFTRTGSLDDEASGRDVLICWDYRDLGLDAGLLGKYDEIRVLAWSMGVWAAGRVFGTADFASLPVSAAIAVCGTPTPIDDSKGIPEAIFDGTLAGLSERTLTKFRRRMCGSAEALEELLSCGFTRSVEELREELAAISQQVREGLPTDSVTGLRLSWSQAIVGSCDMIFPPANQQAAWESLGVPVRLVDSAHYDARLFQSLLYEKEPWTRI